MTKDLVPFKIKVIIMKDEKVLGEGEVEVTSPYEIWKKLSRAYKIAKENVKES